MMRHTRTLDHIIQHIDTAVRTVLIPKKRITTRPNPAENISESSLTPEEKHHIAGLVRVNHAGEVCAQALYQGQALTARLTSVKAQMTQAAIEEIEHLAWCETRLQELDSHPSYLNPFWYTGSLLIGAFAGLIGDQWSLGFVAETERQVSTHLAHHLARLPARDEKTKAILSQMQHDETQHAEAAIAAGAKTLPILIKRAMYAISKVLTTSSYHL
jgi:ubiquinone biosynthesis monooxygenase Coq7